MFRRDIFSEEHDLFRETVRRFVETELAPHAQEWEDAAYFADWVFPRMGELGFLGLHYPTEYGGQGGDYFCSVVLSEEMARARCGGLGMAVAVQTDMATPPILKFGTEEQKHHYLPKLCSGEWLGCFGLTEPDTGSDAASQKTRARKTDSGWVINGSKMFISLGNHAKVALIFAQTDASLAHRGVACFLVDTDQPGFQPQEIHHKLGLRGSDTASIGLDDVEAGEMLGEVGDGFKVAMSSLDSGRYSVASGCVGICQGSLDASVQYSKDRIQFGRPIASFQLVQEMLTDIALNTEAARMLVWRAGWLKDAGKPNTTETSMAKLFATEAAVHCANQAIQVHGGSGYVDDYPVERYLRDVRVTTLYEGTSQIQKLIIGRALTGINALVPS